MLPNALLAALALVLAGCAGSRPADSAGGPQDWRRYRNIGISATASAPKAEIERNWLERMTVIELQRTNLFAAVQPIGEGAPAGLDLRVELDITRLQLKRALKLSVRARFFDARSGERLGEERWSIKTSIRPEGLAQRHKAAGQAGIRVAEQLIVFLRSRRR